MKTIDMASLVCISLLSFFPFTASLPAPFIIPLYADVESEGIYISTTLSMGTLVTILIFVGLSVYAVA